ncbi:MAG TPA: hypothetical protein VE007_03390 [Thermoanaerobaculia bacterium]|nr:hypothetical protein [Thermoanaerobaculia bacterium]
MVLSQKRLGILAAALFAISTLAVAVDGGPPLVNWNAPATYTPSGKHIMSGELGGGPMPFFPITPCRQFDSRNTSVLTSGVDRTITVTGAPCGVPAGTLAVSVNITIFNISGAGGNGTLKLGIAAAPTTSWINYPPTETQRANAGAVPLSNTGTIVVQAAQGGGTLDLIVDINGYYYNGAGFLSMPTGDIFGIIGDFSGGGLNFVRNVQPTAANSYSVRGQTASTGTGSAGVYGESYGATGTVSGVLGTVVSTSPLSSGVRGIAATGEPTGASGCCSDIGVLGESKTGEGVAGISEGIAGFFDLKNSSGTAIATAFLGYKPSTTTYAVYAGIGDYGGTGAKYFVEPHPTEASKVIHYISLEGGEAGTYSRGTAQVVGGWATIQIPEDFRMVTEEDGMTVLLTPVGAQASMYIVSQDLNTIVVRSNKDVKFHYMVNGVRRGYKSFQPIGDGAEFMPLSPNDRIPEGLSTELKRRLVANGTYNEDGTVNMGTAEKMGWTKAWEEKAAATAKAAAANKAIMSKNGQAASKQ